MKFSFYCTSVLSKNLLKHVEIDPKHINVKSNTKSNEGPSNFIPHGHPCPKMRRQRQKRVVDCQKKSFGKSLEVHRGVAFFLPVSKLPFLSKAEQGSSVRRLLLLLLLSEAKPPVLLHMHFHPRPLLDMTAPIDAPRGIYNILCMK